MGGQIRKNKYWIKKEIMDEDRLDPYYYSDRFIELEEQFIKLSLRKYKIGDLFRVLDGDHGSVELVPQGITYLRAQNILDSCIDYDKLVYISKEQHNKSKRSKIFNNDILISVMASTGMSAVFNKNFECNANRAVGILRGDNEIIDKYFLVSLINSKIGGKIFSRGIRGSIQKRLNLSDIGEVIIPLPTIEIQKYIGDKVRKSEELREEAKGAKGKAENILDDKIDSILIQGKSEIKSHWINCNSIDDRIDGDFYSTKYEILEKIDKYFECITLEKLILDKFTGRTPDKSYDLEKGIPLLIVKNIEENSINVDNVERRIKDNDEFKKTKQGDMLITRVGSVGVTSVIEEENEGLFISDNVISLSVQDTIPKRYVAFYLNSKYGKLMVERWNKGAVQAVINYQSINKFKIPILDKNEMDNIDQCIVSWKKKIKLSKKLIEEAKQDVESLIEGTFDTSKLN